MLELNGTITGILKDFVACTRVIKIAKLLPLEKNQIIFVFLLAYSYLCSENEDYKP